MATNDKLKDSFYDCYTTCRPERHEAGVKFWNLYACDARCGNVALVDVYEFEHCRATECTGF